MQVAYETSLVSIDIFVLPLGLQERREREREREREKGGGGRERGRRKRENSNSDENIRLVRSIVLTSPFRCPLVGTVDTNTSTHLFK